LNEGHVERVHNRERRRGSIILFVVTVNKLSVDVEERASHINSDRDREGERLVSGRQVVDATTNIVGKISWSGMVGN